MVISRNNFSSAEEKLPKREIPYCSDGLDIPMLLRNHSSWTPQPKKTQNSRRRVSTNFQLSLTTTSQRDIEVTHTIAWICDLSTWKALPSNKKPQLGELSCDQMLNKGFSGVGFSCVIFFIFICAVVKICIEGKYVISMGLFILQTLCFILFSSTFVHAVVKIHPSFTIMFSEMHFACVNMRIYINKRWRMCVFKGYFVK